MKAKYQMSAEDQLKRIDQIITRRERCIDDDLSTAEIIYNNYKVSRHPDDQNSFMECIERVNANTKCILKLEKLKKQIAAQV